MSYIELPCYGVNLCYQSGESIQYFRFRDLGPANSFLEEILRRRREDRHNVAPAMYRILYMTSHSYEVLRVVLDPESLVMHSWIEEGF